MTRAYVFPGQGAQAIGMGKALADAYPAAAAIFDEVDEALSERLSTLIWEGDIDTLTLTRNAQPALMACSLAAVAALEAEGTRIADGAFVAGHSLGEYSALAAAGALGLTDTARLLRLRGEAMQKAVPVGEGAMAAILGLDLAAVTEICSAAGHFGTCEPANDNDPGQVVISGNAAAVDHAVKAAKDRGAKRAVMLPVSAPFHCTLMVPAAEAMRAALEETPIDAPSVPLIANVTAQPTSDPEIIRKQLVTQVTGAVRWRESVQTMAASGVTEVWELGAGKTLGGLNRRIDKSLTNLNIATPDDLKAALDRAG